MAKLQKLSNNELSELQGLLWELQTRIKDYCHIEQHVDKHFLASLTNQTEKAEKERQRRENLTN